MASSVKLNFNFFERPFHSYTSSFALRKHRSLRRHFRSSASSRASGGRGGESNHFLLPGATMATLAMLGLLHARRLYCDQKREEAREKGVELEFSPDFKASFLRMVPLRTISRAWGIITDIDLPVWFRPVLYRSWARAFHSKLDEAEKPLHEYANLREFFVRRLKEGSRIVNQDPNCLVSPVDGVVLRCGLVRMPEAMIEQVKGFSYSAIALLGKHSVIPISGSQSSSFEKNVRQHDDRLTQERSSDIALDNKQSSRDISTKGFFYCVLYLGPGDYHRVHSPVDWDVKFRRHFSGRLFPVNERASRTIRNLHVENERVVLEGTWSEGYLALVAVGATNVGSIELPFEPELVTNRPKRKLSSGEAPNERIYQHNNGGLVLKKGEEVAVFNMGSTVVLVFQAPYLNSSTYDKNAGTDLKQSSSSVFKFLVKKGDRVQMGQAIGQW